MAANFSSSKLGQGRIAELEERIKKLPFPNLFLEVKELKKNNKLSQVILQKLHKTQESIKKNEQELFEQHAFYGNLFTVICLHLDENDESDEEDHDITAINSYVLNRFPENITAQLNQFYICISDEDIDSAEKIVDGLEQRYVFQEERNDLKLEELYPRIDIAYLYHQLDPKLYYQSVEHYEICLRKAAETLVGFNETANTPDIVQKAMKDMHVWQYYLLVTYNRLLNSGFLCIQEDSSQRVRTEEMCFRRICELGQELLVTEQKILPVILARTLVDLYDAHFKMKFELKDNTCHCTMCRILCELSAKGTQLLSENSSFPFTVPLSNKMDSLLPLALKLTPNDGHILEKIGRLKRMTAQSEHHLQEAKDMLEKCVSLCPTRHVAWHQLGKTYRSLWLYPNHKDFYSNPIRLGQQKKRKKKKKKCSDNDLFCVIASDVAKWGLTGDITKSEEGAISTEKHTTGSVLYVPVQQGNSTSEKEILSDKKQILPESQVVKSRNFESDKLPQHHRKIDWFDHFRTENPLVSEKDAPEYLKQALDCFKKANDIVNGTSCRLWVDLSRLYISMKNNKQAEKCFVRAKKCTTATLHDKGYLYEQWGLFTHLNLKQLEKAKSLYRHAVEYSVQSFEKSKVAFYNLRDILKEQLNATGLKTSEPPAKDITDTEQIAGQKKLSLEKEYALLQKLVANFTEAKSMLCEIMSREKWRGQKDLRNLAWDLVDIFAATDCFEHAWCYINSNLIYAAEKKHHKLILDVSFGLARQLNVIKEGICMNDDDQEGLSQGKDVLSVVFHYLSHPALKRTESEGTAPAQDTSQTLCPQPISRSLSESYVFPKQAYDVLLVTDDAEPVSYYTTVRSTLVQCGLSIRCEQDIMFGTIPLVIYSQLAMYAKMVLIFTDDIMSNQKRQLSHIAHSILNEVTTEGLSTHIVCLYSGGEQACDLHNYANVKVIGIPDLLQGLDGTQEFSVSHKYAFLRKLFDILCV